jgi:hypothetical protein
VTKTLTPAPQRAGTRYSKNIRRSKASQARLDAILGAIGDNPDELRKLLVTIAEITPGAILINS